MWRIGTFLAVTLAVAGCAVATTPASNPAAADPSASPTPASVSPSAGSGAEPTPSAACPSKPWTLAALVATPKADRAVCFGSAEITLVATGGLVEEVLPVIPAPAFGRRVGLASGGGPAGLDAWVPERLPTDAAARHALGMTSPGMGLDAWHDVWWRVRGHFDDPASAGCGVVEGTAGESYFAPTAEAAAAWCRNEFVLDDLAWLQVPPTDPAGGGVTP